MGMDPVIGGFSKTEVYYEVFFSDKIYYMLCSVDFRLNSTVVAKRMRSGREIVR